MKLAFFSFLASYGFAILFNVPKDKLIAAGFCGAIGGLGYGLSLDLGITTVTSLFIGSLMLSITAELLARKLKTPSTIFSACALIPLVPGGGMYFTMLNIVNNNFEQAISTGINTIAQACAIMIGCFLVSSIFRSFKKVTSKKV